MTRKLSWFFFTLIFIFGLRIWTYAAWHFQSRAWIDEVWVVLNPAYQLFSHSSAPLQGDWSYGIRSWIPPILLATYLKVLSVLGFSSGTLVLPIVRTSFAIANLFGAFVFLQGLSHCLKLRTAPFVAALFIFLTPEFAHLANSADLSSMALPFLLISLGIRAHAGGLQAKTRTSTQTHLADFFICLAASIRFQFWIFPLVQFSLLAIRKNWKRFFELLTIASLTLATDFAINSWMVGRPVLPVLNYFYENTVGGMASSFGTTPAYFSLELFWRIATEPVAVLSVLTCTFALKRMPFVAGSSFLLFLAHALTGHKEYRFFFVPSLLLSAISGLAFQKWLEERLSLRLQHHRHRIGLSLIAVLVCLSFLCFAGWRARRKTDWHAYEIPSHLETLAGTRPDLKGLITYGWGGIYSGGPYTLYRPLPYEFAQSLSELHARKVDPRNFNYVIKPEQGPRICAQLIRSEHGGSLFKCTLPEMKRFLE